MDIQAEYDIIDSVRNAAERILDSAKGSHAWDHTLRVTRLCERIGDREGADRTVLCIAAYLHDIGRSRQDAANGTLCHAEIGAKMAESIVAPLPFSDDRKKNIVHCIRTHRFRGDHKPETLEARILFDADKLDAIGAVGVARAYLFAGEVGARLHNTDNNVENTKPYTREDTGYREFKVKLSRIRDRMITPTGKEMADSRHAFMVEFFNRFIEEVEGKR